MNGWCLDMEQDVMQKETRDLMQLMAEESENMIESAAKSAAKEADEETTEFLLQYEQKARQIILKIRAESSVKADAIAERFRDALMLRIEEASMASLNQVITGVSLKTGEIIKRLQESAKREARQALAEGLTAGSSSSTAQREIQNQAVDAGLEMSVDVVGISVPADVNRDNQNAVNLVSDDFARWLQQ
jgi:hypothetical protein